MTYEELEKEVDRLSPEELHKLRRTIDRTLNRQMELDEPKAVAMRYAEVLFSITGQWPFVESKAYPLPQLRGIIASTMRPFYSNKDIATAIDKDRSTVAYWTKKIGTMKPEDDYQLHAIYKKFNQMINNK